MTKKFWVKIIPWNKKLLTTALESGASAVYIPRGNNQQVKELGIIKTISPDGDLRPGKNIEEITINNKEDEERAAALNPDRPLIIQTKNWKIIPMENLVAQRGNLIACVQNAKEAKTALGILEKGVDGILLETNSHQEIKNTAKVLQETSEMLKLVKAKITSIQPLGMSDRVCIDTTSNMKIGQGMLIGDTSKGMFLVHAESVENPYVASRPFRVNAGAVHAYVRIPEGKTKYLSDLKTGDKALIVNHQGKTETSFVGRIKMERRPMMLIKAKAGKETISLIMQNAETIRLTTAQGKPVSIVHLKKGEEVLAYLEEAGRHFGMKIKETILEK